MSSSLSKIEELGKDIAEYRSLLAQATRQKVKDTISLEIRKLETDLTNKEDKQRQEEAAKQGRLDGAGDADASGTEGAEAGSGKPTAQVKPIYTKQLDTYGWDQSDKFMKLYVTIKGVQSLAKDKVQCDFTSDSITLKINELENFNYQLRIVNLLHPIISDQSYIKVKTDSVLVMLRKEETGKTWGWVTQQEKKVKDKPTKKADFDKEDPNASMMKLMQQMYDDGDDDMKRTITKAWYESRNKTPGADMPGMPGMPGL